MGKGDILLQFINYKVTEMNFKINDKLKVQKVTEFEMEPKFERRYEVVDENIVNVIFSIKIDNESGKLPFSLGVTISGKFLLNGWKGDKEKEYVLKNNTLAILFPYLRMVISNLTLNAGITPFVLPPINVANIFKDEVEIK